MVNEAELLQQLSDASMSTRLFRTLRFKFYPGVDDRLLQGNNTAVDLGASLLVRQFELLNQCVLAGVDPPGTSSRCRRRRACQAVRGAGRFIERSVYERL